MTVRSVRVLCLAKILGSIYAGPGLVFGVILAAIAVFGGLAPAAAEGDALPALLGFLMGGGLELEIS